MENLFPKYTNSIKILMQINEKYIKAQYFHDAVHLAGFRRAFSISPITKKKDVHLCENE